MADAWKVRCERTGFGAKGTAEGEFSRMGDAVFFARTWLAVGWNAWLTHPDGREIRLEHGRRARFPRIEQGSDR